MKLFPLLVSGVLFMTGSVAFAEDTKTTPPADASKDKKVGSDNSSKPADSTQPGAATEKKAEDSKAPQK